jgi:hypothetical protein
LNLTPALLIVGDLEPGWTVSRAAAGDDDGIFFDASFLRLDPQTGTVAVLTAILANDPITPPARAADDLVMALRGRSEGGVSLMNLVVTPVAAPDLGQEAARRAVTGRLGDRGGSTPVTTDVIVWRRGPIMGAILLTSNARADALTYAQRQDAKLMSFLSGAAVAGAMPPAPSVPSAMTTAPAAVPPSVVAVMPPPVDAPYRGLVSCDSFTNQEAAQAALLAYAGDPYGLDPDGNGVACESLPRRADPATQTRPAAASAMAALPPPQPVAADRPFDAQGTGSGRTDAFSAMGRIELCTELAGTEPSVEPLASFTVLPLSAMGNAFIASVTGQRESRCTALEVPVGAYTIVVVAPPTTHWQLTVRLG